MIANATSAAVVIKPVETATFDSEGSRSSLSPAASISMARIKVIWVSADPVESPTFRSPCPESEAMIELAISGRSVPTAMIDSPTSPALIPSDSEVSSAAPTARRLLPAATATPTTRPSTHTTIIARITLLGPPGRGDATARR